MHHEPIYVRASGFIGHEDHSVIGVPDMIPAGVFECGVQPVEDRIGERWGKRTALGQPDRSGLNETVLVNSAGQSQLDELGKVGVAQVSVQYGEGDGVKNRIEEVLDVQMQYPIHAPFQGALTSGKRLARAASGPVSEAAGGEARLPQ